MRRLLLRSSLPLVLAALVVLTPGAAMARTVTLPPQALVANQWFFSAPITITATNRDVTIQATDPNNQWFTRAGNVKAWGLQLEGYVGGPWDNQAPWAGWGWWIYPVPLTGDVKAALILPQYWQPFGTSVKNNGVTLPLFMSISSSNAGLLAGQRVRLAVQTDTDITLGTQITLL